MIKILPFNAIRPKKDKVHLVVTKSLESYDLNDKNYILKKNPYSFLQIISAKRDRKIKLSQTEIYKNIRNRFDDFINSNILFSEKKSSYYVYCQEKVGKRKQIGIIALASLEDYENQHIKRHEHTLTSRENKLKDYLIHCPIHVEPVSFIYAENNIINRLIQKTIQKRPIYHFSEYDGLKHTLWKISKKKQKELIFKQFQTLESLYISDGHHRIAASNLYRNYCKDKNPNHFGNEPYNYLLGVFYSDSEIEIFEYNRVVKSLGGRDKEQILGLLKKDFELKEMKVSKAPKQLHEIMMYFDKQWYLLTPKFKINKEKMLNQLDSYILNEKILNPILGIKDIRNDKRIAFVPSIDGLDQLQSMVDNNQAEMAFSLYPISVEQLKVVSDEQDVMPPKSTWIEPKLRSALTIFDLTKQDLIK